jgi:uncharacterized membrane protein YkoI
MKHTQVLAIGITIGILAACSSSTTPDTAGLRGAINKSKVTLGQSVSLAQEDVENGLGVKAALIPQSNPVFSVDAVGGGTLHDVRVDAISGSVISNTEVGAGSDPCPGSIPLPAAIAIAEERAHGTAVQVQPDDDDRCFREIIVLGRNDVLWEVKLDRDGSVLEVEQADNDD